VNFRVGVDSGGTRTNIRIIESDQEPRNLNLDHSSDLRRDDSDLVKRGEASLSAPGA
jgi:hypothetical protein